MATFAPLECYKPRGTRSQHEEIADHAGWCNTAIWTNNVGKGEVPDWKTEDDLAGQAGGREKGGEGGLAKGGVRMEPWTNQRRTVGAVDEADGFWPHERALKLGERVSVSQQS